MRQWLLERRTEMGKTQLEIAESSGIKREYYNMIENGYRKPSVTVAKKIGNAMDIEWTLFFEEKVTV